MLRSEDLHEVADTFAHVTHLYAAELLLTEECQFEDSQELKEGIAIAVVEFFKVCEELLGTLMDQFLRVLAEKGIDHLGYNYSLALVPNVLVNKSINTQETRALSLMMRNAFRVRKAIPITFRNAMDAVKERQKNAWAIFCFEAFDILRDQVFPAFERPQV